jgi:archaellum component FlaF (FlaF/FlaG flagellin family)
MPTKRYFTFIVLIFITYLSASSQPRLSLDKETYVVGQIEWKKPLSVKYTVSNTGNRPLVLTHITASCGCISVGWTKSPIQPGGKGAINITYDTKLLGRFHKSVSIYSNASSELTYLNFTGTVVQNAKDYEEIYPYAFEQIRMDKREILFSEVYHGEYPEITLNIINLSDQPYEPLLMHLPPFLKMERNPNILKKKEKGTIKLTFDSKRLNEQGLIQASTYLSRFPNDEVNRDNEIPIRIILLPNTSRTNRNSNYIPAIKLSETDLVFDVKSFDKEDVSRDITVTNTGQSPLQIEKLQVTHPGIEVKLKKSLVQPGKSTTMKINLQKKKLILSDGNRIQVLVITNDPVQPLAIVNVKTYFN